MNEMDNLDQLSIYQSPDSLFRFLYNLKSNNFQLSVAGHGKKPNDKSHDVDK